MEIKNYISNEDLQILFEIINTSLLCESDEDYKKLIEQLKRLIPFDSSLNGFVDFRRISYEDMLNKTVNCGYPLEFNKIYAENKYHLKDTIIQRFYKTLDIQYSCDFVGVDNYGPENPVFILREEFGINNEFIYGLGNNHLGLYAFFSIYGKQVKNDKRTRMIIKYLTPFLLTRLLKLIPNHDTNNMTMLTPTELEILNWVKEGKSSWEISLILHKSERCINFHISNILKKLDAMNRTHAVAKAFENNLITI